MYTIYIKIKIKRNNYWIINPIRQFIQLQCQSNKIDKSAVTTTTTIQLHCNTNQYKLL